MGILGFYGDYIKKNIPESIEEYIPEDVSSLAFDLNGVIHAAKAKVFEAGRDATPEEKKSFTKSLKAIYDQQCGYATLNAHLEIAISEIILFMVDKFKPKDVLIIAVDGVAPGAKMQQQKARRQKTAMLKHNLFFDGASITPGTEFMRNVDEFLQRFFIKNKMSLPPKIIYSSHMVPGEGEHKIMDFYRNGEVDAEGKHVLYGLDADLVMLSLLSPVENIYLSRETHREIVNINKFKKFLIDEYGEKVIDDFVIMMFFLGNDFLPKSPALSQMSDSINFLLEKYKRGRYKLSKGKAKINWSEMKRFLEDISKEEPTLCKDSLKNTQRKPYESIKNSFDGNKFKPNEFRKRWYTNALGPRTEDKDFVSKLKGILKQYTPSDEDELISPVNSAIAYDGIKKVTEVRIYNMCHDYLTTLSWIYLYYKQGTSAINQDWLYPYYHTPLLIDLSDYMQSLKSLKRIRGYKAYADMKTFTVLHQLIAVLPLKSKNLLPLELQPLFGEGSMLQDLFPEKIEIETDGLPINRNTGMVNEEEGVAIVPIVDRNRILDAVAQITFYDTEMLKKYKPAETKYFELTSEEKERKKYFDRSARAESSRAEGSRGSSFRGESSRPSFRGESSRGTSARGESSRPSFRGESSRGTSARGESSRPSFRGESSRGSSFRGESSRPSFRGSSFRGESSRPSFRSVSEDEKVVLPTEKQEITFLPMSVIKSIPNAKKSDFLIK
jgi:5'-3' exonuclease